VTTTTVVAVSKQVPLEATKPIRKLPGVLKVRVAFVVLAKGTEFGSSDRGGIGKVHRFTSAKVNFGGGEIGRERTLGIHLMRQKQKYHGCAKTEQRAGKSCG
jgi:hypothetical protein